MGEVGRIAATTAGRSAGAGTTGTAAAAATATTGAASSPEGLAMLRPRPARALRSQLSSTGSRARASWLSPRSRRVLQHVVSCASCPLIGLSEVSAHLWILRATTTQILLTWFQIEDVRKRLGVNVEVEPGQKVAAPPIESFDDMVSRAATFRFVSFSLARVAADSTPLRVHCRCLIRLSSSTSDIMATTARRRSSARPCPLR